MSSFSINNLRSVHVPNVDPTNACLAFGDRALPKLNRELQGDDLFLRQQAVSLLDDLLHEPQKIAQALRIGIVKSLLSLLAAEDAFIRDRTVSCLLTLASHAIGRRNLLENDAVHILATRLDDIEPSVRNKVNQVLDMLVNTKCGAQQMIKAGLIPKLIQKLQTECDAIKVVILSLLRHCLMENKEEALSHNAMEILEGFLHNQSVEIRAGAAYAIAELAVSSQGKIIGCNEELLRSFLTLLQEPVTSVQAKSACALMFLTITTEGKLTCVRLGAVEHLLSLVEKRECRELQLNVIKTLTNLAETPSGRNTLLAHLESLEKLTQSETDIIQTAAERLIATILWKP